ncbi:MAG: LexA family protein [Acetivibrionales bacterium]|jgi:repressor LexA
MPIHFAALTSKQKKVFSAIESYIKTNGIPPTVREIGEMLGEKTPGAVQGILNRLEQKGVIKRQVGMARSIKIVTPEMSLYLEPVYIPEIKKINMRNIDDLLNIYNIKHYQPISPEILSCNNNCFIFSCPDNSLTSIGINQSDKLLFKATSDICDGDIILALYDNHLLIRKFLQDPQHGLLILEADNYYIDKKTFRKDEVRIAGKLLLSIKKY